MAYMQSPGIEVKEYDLTGYVPGVATTLGGIGGVFAWGPVEVAELMSDENELVLRFGKPTADNFETWHIAANFLAYSKGLYVVRAADANSYNARANTGTVANVQIKNDDHFSTLEDTLSANVVAYARYPGVYGNSLKISICDSANAYTKTFSTDANTGITLEFVRDTFQATLSVEDLDGANNTVANTAMHNILDDLAVGDWIKAYDANLGSQFLKVSVIGSSATANGVAEATLTFSNRFRLADNVSMTSVTRYWEYYTQADRAPGTSIYAAQRGGVGDELHVIVADEDGVFTGVPGTVLERWTNLSRALDATGQDSNGSLYWRDVINRSSRFVYVLNETSGAAAVNTASSSTAVDTLPTTLSLSGGTDSLSESAVPLSVVSRAYDKFKNDADLPDLSLIIAGKAKGGTHGEALANYIIDNIAEVRRDLFVTISPDVNDLVNNPFQEVADLTDFRNALRKTSYAMVSTAYKYQYDRYNDRYRWIAGCGDDAGLIARTDNDRDPWWSPAGHNRGIYKNIIRLAYNPDKADRDLLYPLDLNPVITERGSGTILFGDKTLWGAPSAFDRINVRRLFITLEKAIVKATKAYLFEFNDEFTRARFRNMVEPYLRDVQGRRGIIDFRVVCDTTNNTGIVIDQNRFIADIYIKPARSINFITLNFVAVGTDAQFEYVVGQF